MKIYRQARNQNTKDETDSTRQYGNKDVNKWQSERSEPTKIKHGRNEIKNESRPLGKDKNEKDDDDDDDDESRRLGPPPTMISSIRNRRDRQER